MKAILCSLALLLAVAAHADARKIAQIDGSKKIVYCYWRAWGDIPVEHIAENKICTHYAFAFMGINRDYGRMMPIGNDNPGSYENALNFSQTIRRLHPGAKIMVAVGGRGDQSIRYSTVADSPKKRRAFIDSVVEFMNEFDYDGVDLDWEYQSPRDNYNFIIWMQEIRAELDKTGRQLTCAVGANSGFVSLAHNVTELAEAAHFINLMTFDLHDSWPPTTGHHAPMRDDTPNNVRDIVALWRQQGAPANKLVLGIPFYGRAFRLRSRLDNGIGAPAFGPGIGSFLPYKAICLDKDWELRWDYYLKATYAFKGDHWVGFDNERSMEVKAKFIEDEGLAGAVVWAVDNDDVYGRCGAGKLPLLNALNASLIDSRPIPPVTQQPPTNPEPETSSPSGFFRDPADCSKFYMFHIGVRYPSQKCPLNLMFDNVGKFCNDAKFVQC